MHALCCFLLTMLAAPGSPSASSAWEKVFDGHVQGSVSTVRALARDRWIVGGSWGLATATRAGTSVASTHGRGVLGLFVESPTSTYALGEGELIWHLDARKWTEEHAGPLLPRAQRRSFADHMLHLAYYDDTTPNGPLVALGLSLVLVKQPDGTWAPPPASDKKRLLDAGQLGPKIPRPAKCDLASWHWLGRNRGAFYCHDRRAFIFDAGQLTPKGKLPSPCYDALHSLVEGKGELYASCHAATLWRTKGEDWRRVDPPREKNVKEIPSISVADGCLFAAAEKSVWRTCD